MIPEVLQKKEEFREAFTTTHRHNWNKKELEVYEYVSLKESDDINALQYATLQGKQEGKKEGRKEGLIEVAKTFRTFWIIQLLQKKSD